MPRMPLDPSSSRISEEQFAKFFGIPRQHSLRCTKYEAGMDITEWEHEERDASGVSVARYRTWLGFDESGAGTGSQKYGPDGGLIEQRLIPIEDMLAADSKRI
jgi:hypothetical protein